MMRLFKVLARVLARMSARVLAMVLVLALCSVLLSACALPRITVLRDPLTAQEHLQLGLAYEAEGKSDLAKRHYKDAAKELPQAHYYLGNLAFIHQDWTQAEQHYEKAIKGLPDDPRPRNNLAWLYCTQGRLLERAEKLANQAMDLAVESERAQYADTLEKIRQARSVR